MDRDPLCRYPGTEGLRLMLLQCLWSCMLTLWSIIGPYCKDMYQLKNQVLHQSNYNPEKFPWRDIMFFLHRGDT